MQCVLIKMLKSVCEKSGLECLVVLLIVINAERGLDCVVDCYQD